jgi:hypothetical protein
MRIEQICKEFEKEVEDFLMGFDMSDDLFQVLYDYYFDSMPYTIQTGDDDSLAWVHDRFHSDVYDELKLEI